MTTLSRIAALLLFAVIAFATLSPIQLRPHLADANIERGIAYVLFGLALALSFPRRLWLTVAFAVATAGLLEFLQLIDPSRHARLTDAVLKAAAGIAGIVVGRILFRVFQRGTSR